MGLVKITSRTSFNPFPRFSGALPEINSVKATSTATTWLSRRGRTWRKVSKIPNPRSAKTIILFSKSYPKKIPGVSGHLPILWANELSPIPPVINVIHELINYANIAIIYA